VDDRYFQEKLRLYMQFSRFACAQDCPRYGCRSDLVVSASLLEIHGQAEFLKRPALEVFRRAYRLSPVIDQGLHRVRMRFTLRKPCVFLENGLTCGIYASRPAVCALFPEYLASFSGEERRRFQAANDIAHYPCVAEGGLLLTAEREEAIRRLWRIHEKELLATEIYLFGLAGFGVDLRQDMAALAGGAAGEIPYAIVEKALDRRIAREGLSGEIEGRIAALDTGEGMENYWSALPIVEALLEGGI